MIWQKDEVYLNLVMEFIPETVYRVARHYNKNKQFVPFLYIKVGQYQKLHQKEWLHLTL